ncbi:hypothetical protein FSPOR_4340 [Fusarium sporotrichioides]|uniref:Clr5 domain-containing protein n=1 Tax=Fusarium sporotrichioides TaxID=5514 RepID=A0A395SCB5_FUSSP|nr:hypothetical protein FSPOR_4340 [Fusarium sporotrichioides]
MSQLPADLINVPPELFPESDDHKYLRASHKDRWEHLKPVIIKLYTGNYGKNNKPPTIAQVTHFMKKYYSFHAAANEYPHRFRAWGVSDRRLTKAMVDEIITALGRRPATGLSTSKVTLKRGAKEEKLDVKRVKRHLEGDTSSSRPEIIPSGWCVHHTFIFYPVTHINQAIVLELTICCVCIRITQEPRRRFPIRDTAGNTKLSKNHFLAAKSWGPPPSIVNVHTPSGFTPSAFLELPSSPLLANTTCNVDIVSPPTKLCRWSIHAKHILYEPLPNEPPDSNSTFVSFTDCLHQSIATGDFTELRNDNLPLSHDAVLHSLTENPIALEVDSWKLAIMAGNTDLLHDLSYSNGRRKQVPEEVKSMYPYHLAASFLDGGGPCCTVFQSLSAALPGSCLLQNNINDLGHTILDSLFVSILRSHTSVQPEIVSDGFRALSRFPGEEKDICGRWDADSPEVRELFAEGYARIPTRWKHPFCHSAVQAVCHCAMLIFGDLTAADINCLSGLFIRRCTECGVELRLGPIHTLVATAFFLGQSGMAGETLFGPLAILVCLINMGVDVRMSVNMSLEEIIRTSETGQCNHKPMTAFEMMQSVPVSVIQSWTNSCQAGWDCLLLTLRFAETHTLYMEQVGQHRYDSPFFEDGSDEDSQFNECELWETFHNSSKFKCANETIGILWATIQAEISTYRQLRINDPWISDNFQMLALQAWLQGDTEDFNTPLVNDAKMQVHSRCGWFLGNHGEPSENATASDVCKEWFANLNDYERTTFVH